MANDIRYVLRLIAICFTLTLLAACGGGLPAGYTSQQQTVDGLTITLERPRKAELLQTYTLYVNLADANNKPVDGARVSADMIMPAMPMGSNKPIADPLGNGRYGVKTIFSMEGDWNITVDVSVSGKHYTATFDQVVVPKQS